MRAILIKLKACSPAIEWVGDRTVEQAIQECKRGDWMLWLFRNLFPNELQLLTLTKGHSANTVRHLMSEISIKAVDTAIAFGEGRATREELDAAASAADAADAADADYAAYAAYYAADAADADYAAYAAADSRKSNQLQTADICRKYLGEKLIEGCNKIKEVINEQ